MRQTGSAIKPLAVLAPGIDKKLFTATTVYNDEPTTFEVSSEEQYAPTNNDDYIGEITVRRAVESSQNIPFVKMMQSVTPETSIKYLEKMGISSLTENDKSLSLALGGLDKGITPLEMAAAYATIANDGTYIEPTFYTKVVNSNGKTIIKTKQKKNKVFSKEVACILKQLLKQPVEGSNGTAKYCKMDGMDVAAKTGTTNDNYDKWLCGFTTYYTAVTWYGYDVNETVSYKGKSPAVLLWSAVMKDIHSGLEKTTFSIPNGVKKAEICTKTGNVATSKCEDTYTEYFLSGTMPEQCVGCTGTTNKNNAKSKTNTNTDTNTKNNANTTKYTNANKVTENAVNKSTGNSIVENNVTNTNNKTENETVKNDTNKNTIQNNTNINNTKNNNTSHNTAGGNTITEPKANNNNSIPTPTEEDDEDDGP